MSNATERFSTYPSRATQLQYKIKFQAVQKGHALLKKKADALNLKFHRICGTLDDLNTKIQESFKEGHYSLARAKFHGSDYENIVLQSIQNAQVNLKLYKENVAGTLIFRFQFNRKPNQPNMQLTGISRGGQQIIEARKKFEDLTKLLVEMASLKLCHSDLRSNLISLNRRINSIEYILMPKIKNTLTYIDNEMDEIEREEFYRLKKIQKKKSWLNPMHYNPFIATKPNISSLFTVEDKDILF